MFMVVKISATESK